MSYWFIGALALFFLGFVGTIVKLVQTRGRSDNITRRSRYRLFGTLAFGTVVPIQLLLSPYIREGAGIILIVVSLVLEAVNEMIR